MTLFRVGPAGGGGGIPSALKNAMNAVFNKKFETSSVDYPPEDWPEDVNLMGPLPLGSASGAIAHITDGADTVPLKSLVFFGIEPVQAAGTPSPSNPLPISGHTSLTGVHCGKNLLNPSIAFDNSNYYSYDSATGITTVNASDSRAWTNITEIPIKAGTYCLNNPQGRVQYRLKSESYGTDHNITSSSGTITLTSDDGIKIKFGLGTTYPFTASYQLETGNQATTYAPYSAESKKWEFPPFGKNLLNYDTLVDGHVNTDGTFNTAHTQGEMRSQFIPVEPNTTYYFSIQATGSSYNAWVRIGQYSSANTSSFIKTNSYWSFTTDENAKYIVVSARNLAEATQVQLEKSSTQTAYEPYQSMFSGQVNALTGAVESDAKLFNMGSLTWYADSNRTGLFYTGLISNAAYTECAIMCEEFLVNNAKNPNTISDNEMSSMNSYGSNRIFIKNTAWDGYTGAQVATAVSGIKVLIQLATPISIDMDSVDWQTQLGDNNFWADEGDTSVEYRKDIGLALGYNKYRYLKWTIKATRTTSSYVQMSEISFTDANDAAFTFPTGTTVTATATATSGTSPDYIIDGNTYRKYCGNWSSSGVSLNIDLGFGNTIDVSKYIKFNWYTANDATDRDPYTWELYGINNAGTEILLCSRTAYTPTSDRKALADTVSINQVS